MLKEKLISEYKELERSLSTGIARDEAIAAFERAGFPAKKNEEWRFTNIAPITGGSFSARTESSIDKKKLEKYPEYNFDATVIVIHNGHYNNELSKIVNKDKNVILGNLFDPKNIKSDTFKNNFGKSVNTAFDGFTAVNTSFANAGAFVHVKKNARLEKPLIVLNINDSNDTISNTRNLIVLEDNAYADVSEIYYSENKNVSNSVTEIFLSENSELHHNKIQNDGPDSYHVGTTSVHQEKSSRLFSNVISWGGVFIRNNLNSLLGASGIDCYFRGFYLAKDNQFIDNHTLADHAMPASHSNELYRGILNGNGSAVFNGKIMVRKDAQKTNAYQTNNNILLSDDASANAKPQLEIFADDVKCSHGATTGQIDEEEIFYLRSRGIGETEARKLLLSAFAHQVIDEIAFTQLKERVAALLDEKLSS
ncbi:MAG: Fe-S cluster assembly protein SufD [Bacteroidetes bacterium]|nr:Fe-S cluster assembly protein SufD [Bacteroidota bacterium]